MHRATKKAVRRPLTRSQELYRTRYQRALTTLKRVPDDIVLATASRDIELHSGNSCLVGTFVREKFVQMSTLDFEHTDANSAPNMGATYYCDVQKNAAELFGGTEKEWDFIFSGVVTPHLHGPIELAFVKRVDLAVKRA
jgi:hypothetical protein